MINPEFVQGIETAETAEIREKKRECEEEEVVLSYVRRLLHGKIDLIRAELASRGEEGTAKSRSLLDDLAAVLAPEESRQSRGRLPRLLAPSADRDLGEAGELLSAPVLANLGAASDADLEALIAQMVAQEKETSDYRRMLHHCIDTIDAELTARYASGRATVDELLNPT